jgi:hypothetical protein
VSDAVPVFPSLVAVIWTVPAVTAVARPDAETVANEGVFEFQVIERPVRTLLLASRVTAENWTVPPTWTLAVAGDTVTDATGVALTVIADVPVFVSLVAVIVAVPGATAVTSPEVETVLMPVLLELQVTIRPVRMLLFASRVVAESWAVEPTNRLAVDGDTVTDATGTEAGALTVIADVPVFVSLVAVIVAVPAATAVTRPDAETVLIPVLLELHVTARPVSTLLFASRVVAESWTVAPTSRLAVAGDTDTDATAGGLTVIAADAICPSLDAVTVALPPATAVTNPELETVAIPELLELQPIRRPVSTLLAESYVTADSCTVPPTCSVAFTGDTETDATGIGAGAVTLRTVELLFPELEALIFALPVPVALTVPAVSTVATVMSELSQVTVLPEIGVPVESASVAVARAVCPTTTAEGLTATLTVATEGGGGGTTARVAWPGTPSLTALTTASPTEIPETIPESLTLAIDALDVNHCTERSVRTVPLASFRVAMARAVCPAASEGGTVTETDATGVLVFPTSITEVPYVSQDPQAATMKAMPVTVRIKVRADMRPPL